MNFAFEWFLFYASTMFAMSIDNLTWIPTDNKWQRMKSNFNILIVNNREYVFPKTKAGFKWCAERVRDVNTHPYDIAPAIITSFILTLIW